MGEPDKIVSLSQIKLACKNCSLHELCLPLGISATDLDRLETIISRSRPLRRGSHLYLQGQDFRYVYAIRTGSIKTYTTSSDGSEQITGFHFPGELVGLEGITGGTYSGAAKTLETAGVCEIPFDQLEALTGELPSLRHQVLRIMGKEILEEQSLLMLLGKKSAEARLAALLLSLSVRFQERGFSATEFRLTMTRSDIGNFLGLAVETISRILTRFHEQGLLTAQGKLIQIHDLAALRHLTGKTQPESERRPRRAP